jgi:hypothetical protein
MGMLQGVLEYRRVDWGLGSDQVVGDFDLFWSGWFGGENERDEGVKRNNNFEYFLINFLMHIESIEDSVFVGTSFYISGKI